MQSHQSLLFLILCIFKFSPLNYTSCRWQSSTDIWICHLAVVHWPILWRHLIFLWKSILSLLLKLEGVRNVREDPAYLWNFDRQAKQQFVSIKKCRKDFLHTFYWYSYETGNSLYWWITRIAKTAIQVEYRFPIATCNCLFKPILLVLTWGINLSDYIIFHCCFKIVYMSDFVVVWRQECIISVEVFDTHLIVFISKMLRLFV